MRNYDGHLILKNFVPFLDEAELADIQVIAQNTEKYISFQIGPLRFIDSFQFLSTSLDSLVSNLTKNGTDALVHTRRDCNDDPEQLRLISRKGVFPYEWFDSRDKMSDTKLPPIEDFYSHLSEEGVSDREYAHAQAVWSHFGMKTFKDYHDLYLKTDVLLLADVFESFRAMAKANYHLDVLHYYGAPGFAWDAMLRMTGVELELMSDPDQSLLIEKGIRGGLSMISQRYARANNPLVEGYDGSKPSNYLMYYDANNLYGFAMKESLPTGGFKFLSPREIADFDVTTPQPDDPIGYILEVDLDYPAHLHDDHNDYPLAPESKSVTPDMLSEYGKHLASKLGQKFSKVEKLVPNFYSKEKYVLHIRNLQLYTSLGMVVTKIHRILRFRQSRWLAPYIDFNTEKRRLAANSFEKDLYKLLNNAVFGKTMENMRHRINLRLVTSTDKAKRLTSRSTFQNFKIINENLTAVKLLKPNVKMIKPMYIGMCVLDLSKMHMYNFHYNVIRERYGSKARLLFTDTDSLMYSIETLDVYRDMGDQLRHYDTSDYPTDHPLHSKTNAKVVGVFKDELNGKPAVEFCGLRSKMYSILLPDGKHKNTAKGVKTAFIKKHITHADYKNCLDLEISTSAQFCTIRSFNHTVKTVNISKIALSPYDDKRYLLGLDGSSLTYGHYKIADINSL